jgi:hypothetical protein
MLTTMRAALGRRPTADKEARNANAARWPSNIGSKNKDKQVQDMK